MSIIKAEKAVRRHLLTLSPQLPTAYEAIPFTAPTGMYQRLQFVVNPPTEGEIIVRLYDETPKHRDNFIKLAKEGYFDGPV